MLGLLISTGDVIHVNSNHRLESARSHIRLACLFLDGQIYHNEEIRESEMSHTKAPQHDKSHEALIFVTGSTSSYIS